VIAGVPTEFIAPGPQSFETPPIIDGVDWFTKPVLVSALTVVVIVWFYYASVIFILGGEVAQVYELRRVRRQQREVFTD